MNNRRSTDQNVRVGHIVVFLIVVAVSAIGFSSKRDDKQTIEAARVVGMVAHKITSCGI